MGEMRNIYKSLVGKSERKRPLEKPGVDGRLILNCILRIGRWGVE
jgi:hypothetical protein